MSLWTSKEIEQATGGKASAPFEVNDVSIDTRTLKPGALYVALLNEKDGHDYVEAAFKAGAAGALVRRGFKCAHPIVEVDDTLIALEKLGIAGRNRSSAKIVAVTGSAGKTGTKELLNIAFSAQGLTHASKKSFNNHWGVPLTLANLPKDAAYGVFELGMNHKGELDKLTRMVRPHVALITTVEAVHIAHFKNAEEIADAKAEIFIGLEKGGVAVLPADNAHFLRLKNHAAKHAARIVTFGEEEADTKLIDCSLRADGSKVEAAVLGQKVKYKLGVPGKHIVMNSLGALSVVKAAGGDLDAAIEAWKNSTPVEGRGNKIEVDLGGSAPVVVIDESYNANPASMLAAFSVLSLAEPKDGGRRIAVLGDMLELGPDGPKMHAALANPLLHAKVDLAFCCGAQMEALYQLLPNPWHGGHAKDSQALAPLVAAAVKPGDVVLVKGSAGSKMSYVVQALLHAKKGISHAV